MHEVGITSTLLTNFQLGMSTGSTKFKGSNLETYLLDKALTSSDQPFPLLYDLSPPEFKGYIYK